MKSLAQDNRCFSSMDWAPQPGVYRPDAESAGSGLATIFYRSAVGDAEDDARAYGEAMRAIAGWRVSDRMEAIACPTLAMATEDDYTPVAVKAAWVQRMARANLVVIHDAGHAVPVEKPKEFNAAIEAFLAGQDWG